jgi:hypothetical protein
LRTEPIVIRDYFRYDDHNFALEFDIDESRRIKEQLDKFLLHIDEEKQFWEPGKYLKKLKKIAADCDRIRSKA